MFASAGELKRRLEQAGWRERGAGREGRWSADESSEDEDETRDSSVELLLVSVNTRSLQIAVDLEGCPHESEGSGAGADADWSHGQGGAAGGQVRVVATGLSARHISSASHVDLFLYNGNMTRASRASISPQSLLIWPSELEVSRYGPISLSAS